MVSQPEVLAPLIASVGAGPDEVLAAAATDPIKTRLKDHVRQAQERGLFGAPSFVTADGELFWGNDRLEQALDWAVRHQNLEQA
jgi:2-hydroxychromene-2-carboxylate isomerase